MLTHPPHPSSTVAARGARRSPRPQPLFTATHAQRRADARFSAFIAAGCALLIGCSPDVQPPGEAEETTHNDAETADLRFKVITFNVGTTQGLAHDRGEDDGTGDGYTQAMADVADALYENSLAWNPAEAALTQFLTTQRPAVVAFQEMFFDPWCEDIEVDPNLDFVCRDYTSARPLQIERLLGPDYQVACARGQEDNCVGVRRDFGTLTGCPERGPCLNGVDGFETPGECGSGVRVGGIEVQLKDGRMMTLVNVHGTSGVDARDMACRAAQFEQLFVDRGDGEPVANGSLNLIMGDLNTDPIQFAGFDPSADVWNEHVGPDKRFHLISPGGPDGPASYGLFRIDHIASDDAQGTHCAIPGDEGEPPVLDAIYWDHKPVVCELLLPATAPDHPPTQRRSRP